jgi:peptidoglycan hydrolase-like protein with peptidoglycan-binding domain/uncharacterized membrane-anchored protein YhcB (DUF1043 family)
MSLISVDTEALKDIEKRFGTLSQKIGQTESNLKSIRSNLDSDIKNRNGIDSKLQNLIKELDEEERVLNQAKQFLSKTIKQYQDLEKSMQNKVNEINGDTKPKKNIFSKIFDAVTSPIKKNIEIIQKIISLPVIIGSSIIGNTVIKGVGDILSEEGNTVTNEPIEEKKEKSENSSIPPLSGVLSYNPNVYSEEVLMMQRRLNEIYAGVSGYTKIKEDGYFGSETLAAVNRYKEEHGLWNFGEYAGKVGETTWNHMFSLKIEKRDVQQGASTTGGQANNPAPVSSTVTVAGSAREGGNPSYTEIVDYIKLRCAAIGLPEDIGLAIAWTESSMTQFNKDGNTKNNKNYINGIVDSTDWGIMQINDKSWRTVYDIDKIKTDWKYNVDCGLNIALDKYREAIRLGEENIARATYSGYNTWRKIDRYRTENDPRDARFWEIYQNKPWNAYVG